MKIIKYLFLLVIIISVFSCTTINVRHVGNNSEISKSEGIYYSLPKTEVNITVTVERTDRVEGPFSSYASKYLGLTDVISENSTSFKISSVNISSSSVPDPDQYYFIETKKIKKYLIIDFGEYGILTDVNKRFVKEKNNNESDSSYNGIDNYTELSKQNFINPDIAEAFDTIIEKINLDSTVIIKKTLKKVYVEKTTEQKAKETADLIMELEEARLALLTGYSEVNYSKETVEYMAKQLQNMEDEYLHLFTGVTVQHSQKYYYEYTPSGNSALVSLPLFRFSEKYGICDTSDYKGENVYLNLVPSESTNNINAFEISRLDPKEKHHGIYYRIPEKGSVTLVFNDKQLASSELLIAQIGSVCELQPKRIRSLSLNPESGSVQKIFYGKRRHFFFRHN